MKVCFRLFLAVFVLAGLLSCTSARQMSYLVDMKYGVDYPASPAPDLIIQPEDILGIEVLSDDTRLSAPFNRVSLTEGGTGTAATRTYLVDSDGNIDFPILGRLNVQGKTFDQVSGMIAGRIKAGGYIKEPVVNVNLDNFVVTVIGSMGNMQIPVKGNSINLLEVLSSTGGASEWTDIKNLTVIRTDNGSRKAYKVNLQSKSMFDSPVFYLQQGDVIYVKPKGSRMSGSWQVAMSIVTSGLSLVSVISTILILIRN